MKKIIFLVAGFLVMILSYGQQKAITETGDEVILYTDGTWKYTQDSVKEKTDIPVNPKPFSKNDGASFLVKSTKLNVGIWIDSKKWAFKKANSNEAAEYEFQAKGKDLYGMTITENLPIPLETFESVALINARAAAPDIKIMKKEFRTVNDHKVLLLQMNGTIQGIKFTYYGYYFSNAKGTIQCLTYTAQNLFADYLPEIEDFLNGLVVLD